jgi:hypothetical protein
MKVSLAAQVMSYTVAAGINTLVSAGKNHCTALTQLQYFVINDNKVGKLSEVIVPRI